MGIYNLKAITMGRWMDRIWNGCTVVGWDHSLSTQCRVRIIWDNERWKFNRVWIVELVVGKGNQYIAISKDSTEWLTDEVGSIYNVRMEA